MFGDITVIRPAANVLAAAVGPKGDDGEQGGPGVAGALGPATLYPLANWVSLTYYVLGPPASFVSIGGSSYACAGNHRSNVFATDFANGYWVLVAGAGANGATWFQGSGAPVGGVGSNGDFYFRTDTSDVYQKAAGSWAVIANIKGSPGTNGNTIRSGAGAPSPSVGIDGDFYLDTTPSNPTIYGPKASGAWPTGTSLVGPSGPGSGSVNTSGGVTTGHVAVFGGNATIIQDGGALGNAAFKNTGQVSGTLAAGDDPRITGALQASRALSEVAGLGPLIQAAVRQNIGTLSRGRALALAILN